MNSFRRRRSFGQKRPALQLCTTPRDLQLARIESTLTWVGPPGSYQPVASLPAPRWRWLLYILLHWFGRSRPARKAHDWLARRVGITFVGRLP